VIDPALPVVDPHHHLWARSAPYLVPELLGDLTCGHDIRATVYVEAGFGYRKDGDPRFAGVGEVEYANGVGALVRERLPRAGACVRGDRGQGRPQPRRICGRGSARFCMSRAPDRFRGIRHMTAHHPDPGVSQLMRPPPPDLLLDAKFREGFAQLAPLGLSFDAYCYHPQLPQLIDLVDAFPETRVILDHIGAPLAEGPYAGRRDEVFRDWKVLIQDLARRPNVFVKLGGLSGHLAGFHFIDREKPASSEEMAQAWAPYILTCIEAFGSSRSMFESNFPPDKAGCSARILWNTYKRITASFTSSERADLFAGTAIRAYRLPDSLLQASPPTP
jgi:L-fuconolactonase